MSRYTASLSECLTIQGGKHEVIDGRTVISVEDAELIGLRYYPIFDEEYREILNGLIFDRYMNEEICTESFAMFRQFMRSRMNEIMPYFNKLYETERIEIDPLSTMNIVSTVVGSATSTAEQSSSEDRTSNVDAESTTTSGARNVQSATPQMMLKGDADYASSATDVNSGVTAESDSNEQSTTETAGHATNVSGTESDTQTSGYQGHTVDLLQNFRASIMNIDRDIINSLQDLFMITWGTNDPYTERYYYATY